MPVYEYQCKKCGETFDLFVRSAERSEEPKCPQCGSIDVQKAISLFGVGGSSGTANFAADCGPGPI